MSVTENAYLNYGVPSNWIDNYLDKGLTVSTFRSTSKKNLIERYEIEEQEVDFVKKCLQREPIDEDILQKLLERNNFTCCLCKGTKSSSYIIHHIEEYSKTQDNEYYNLAVLCPNDHDEAHKQGKSLTNKITPDNIRKAKEKWEKQVEKENVRIASINGDIHEIDFLNFHRIIELYSNTIDETPKSRFTDKLIKLGALTKEGFLNMDYIKVHNSNPENPLKFFGGFGSWDLRLHYFDLLRQCIQKLDFVDLDDLLNKKAIQNGNIIGRYCFYVGGLYGKSPDSGSEISKEITHLYLRRKPFFVEWKVDPTYLVSSTARSRMADRTIYIIYGLIRNIGEIERNGEKFIHIDIRPYSFGIPNVSKDRTPIVHYVKNSNDYEKYFDNEE